MNKSFSGADVETSAVPLAPRRNAKRQFIAAVCVSMLIAGGWFGYHWWTVGRWLETTDDAYVDGNTAPISPQVAGHIAEILVTDNQHVSAGQLLIRIDPRLFQAAIDRNMANVKQQEATLDNLHAKYTLQLSTIQQAEADLMGKSAAALFAEQDAKRYLALASTYSGSEQNAQKASSADQQARASVDVAKATVAAAKQQIAVLDTQIAQAEASIGAAKADLETARLNLGYAEIKSPVDGYVGNRAAQVGSYVTAGAYLLTVVPSQGLWVDANFKEDQLARMEIGQVATIVADVAPNHPFKGRIASIAPATGAVFSVIPPENATGNFTKIVQRVPVRIALDLAAGEKNPLRPGLSTTVTINTAKK